MWFLTRLRESCAGSRDRGEWGDSTRRGRLARPRRQLVEDERRPAVPVGNARVEVTQVAARLEDEVLQHLAYARVRLRHPERLHEVLRVGPGRDALLPGGEEAVLGHVDIERLTVRRDQQALHGEIVQRVRQ